MFLSMVLQGCASEIEQVNTDTVHCKLAMDLPKGTVENINKAFGCSGKKIHVIIVSRSQTKTADGTTRISYPAMQEGQINNVIKQLEGKLKVLLQRESNNELKIVVFNEAFFGKDKPLTFDEKDKILKKLREMNTNLKQNNEKSTNTLVIVNILYTQTKKNTETPQQGKCQSNNNKWSKMIDTIIERSKDNKYLTVTYNSHTFLLKNIYKKFIDNEATDPYRKFQTILFNRTFFLNDGKNAGYYDKMAYFEEADGLFIPNNTEAENLDSAAIYCCGDGLVKNETGSEEVNYTSSDAEQIDVISLISAEICRDFEEGVRKKAEELAKQVSQNYKKQINKFLHIIQSNTLVYIDSTNLPPERLTIVADSEGSSGVYYKSAKHVQKFIVSHDTSTDNVVGIFSGTIMEGD